MKYSLTEETKIFRGHELHRIKCVESFGRISKGDKGGFVENEENLSQYGNAWIYIDAMVYDNAQVFGDAQVGGNAQIAGNARIFGSARVWSNAQIYGNARLYGNAKVYGNAQIFEDAELYGNAQVGGNVQVFGKAFIGGNAEIYDNAQVYGNTWLHGEAIICNDAKLSDNADYIVFKNFWSSGRYFTWTRSNNMWKVGCFFGTGEELIKKAYLDGENCGKHYETYVKLVELIVRRTDMNGYTIYGWRKIKKYITNINQLYKLWKRNIKTTLN